MPMISSFQAALKVNKSSDLAQATIDSAAIDNLPGVYLIGNYAGRINFYAQQIRALNLIWALFTSGKIKAGDRVAVIGGGVAGVTAAVGLFQKEAAPVIFERHRNLFPYQRDSAVR